jgi:RHS repeat-associated protein
MQPSRFYTGNGYFSEYRYDKCTDRLVSIRTTHGSKTIQDLVYEYDDFSNLTARNDLKDNHFEQFEYDALNRLTGADCGEGHFEFEYDPLGRMTNKFGPEGTIFNNACYSGAKPYAIKSFQAVSGIFPQERMDLVFNAFDKVEYITEGTDRVMFTYGYNHQRISMSEEIQGSTHRKTYVNGCEFISDSNKGDIVRTFLTGPSGVFAVAETFKGKTTLHYIHKDHLGSWTIVSDNKGNIEQERHFDAWGNCPDTDKLMFDRGYTGHEHIRGMGLINMNGRLYDPVTSSMLSPDNNIQMPDFTQNLNRYTYCLNNPLTYTDPDGNSFLESALIFYLVYCTDFGYEYQKYTQALAVHIDLHLSSQQIGLGFDFSLGIPQKYGISYRSHLGATYYCRFYDNSYSGFEFRLGGEWRAAGCIGYSGTSFFQSKGKQTTNSIIIGTYWCDLTYENDYMFNLGKYIPCIPTSDNGDRYRSAAARFRLGVLSVGVNLFTGDPGVDHEIRNTFDDPDANGRETYTISANGDNPDEYRAGLFYVGLGPLKIGANSEQIRNIFQNKFAHDFLCRGNSPYFKVLDRPSHAYFYFGTETGNTLW